MGRYCDILVRQTHGMPEPNPTENGTITDHRSPITDLSHFSFISIYLFYKSSQIMRIAFFFTSILTAVAAFAPNSSFGHPSKLQAIKTTDVPSEGDRSLVDGPNGTIIVTKSGGKFYAVDAKCPHLGLPMKKGKIEAGSDGVPVITCNFHNSCFKMDSGKCTKWVTGALGQENGLIAGFMSKVGSEKTDVKAYKVSDNGDGSLTIE